MLLRPVLCLSCSHSHLESFLTCPSFEAEHVGISWSTKPKENARERGRLKNHCFLLGNNQLDCRCLSRRCLNSLKRIQHLLVRANLLWLRGYTQQPRPWASRFEASFLCSIINILLFIIEQRFISVYQTNVGIYFVLCILPEYIFGCVTVCRRMWFLKYHFYL